ncbi:hypothetical protein [Streptomyces sp. NPDC017202]
MPMPMPMPALVAPLPPLSTAVLVTPGRQQHRSHRRSEPARP